MKSQLSISRRRRIRLVVRFSLVALILAGVWSVTTPPAASVDARPPARRIILATTTSAQDSGILDHLIPIFRAETGIEVDIVALGTGQALATARRGDADVVLVHSRPDEARFMAEGYGRGHWCVMYNDYVIVGPGRDPAGLRLSTSLDEAISRLASGSALFISRGDNSGTHKKELSLWEGVSIDPASLKSRRWYISAGTGMGEVLRMADEMQAYALVDRGTYLANRKALSLQVVFEGDPDLINPYSVMTINPDKLPGTHCELGHRFAEFLIAPKTQALISRFGVDKYGEPLFMPLAGKCAQLIGCDLCK
ncbi:MAG: substrate-binding domain-containing protein [Firmicutes bacterium]|nr:substrate-binding domain-containing protein [Bacillota bacterium]